MGVWESTTYTGAGGVVTIGNFDGVHLGHQALLQRAKALDRGPVIAYTFDPVPRDVLRPDNGVLRIQRREDRVRSLLAHGAEEVVIEHFDLDFAARTPRSFAHDILRDRLRATALVIGWDFRFGRGREGDAEGLRRLLALPVEQVGPVRLDGEPVSSSRVRALVAAGEVEAAARLLSRPHRIVGVVERGLARGRQLGFPTANLRPLTPLLPAPGVYAVRVGPHIGVANHGDRPTFPDAPPAFEVHLLDFDGDLYGQQLELDLVTRLRGERRFDGRDALITQIRADIGAARAALQPG